EETQYGRIDGYRHALAYRDGEHPGQKDQREIGDRQVAVGNESQRKSRQRDQGGEKVVGRGRVVRAAWRRLMHATGVPGDGSMADVVSYLHLRSQFDAPVAGNPEERG